MDITYEGRDPKSNTICYRMSPSGVHFWLISFSSSIINIYMIGEVCETANNFHELYKAWELSYIPEVFLHYASLPPFKEVIVPINLINPSTSDIMQLLCKAMLSNN